MYVISQIESVKSANIVRGRA